MTKRQMRFIVGSNPESIRLQIATVGNGEPDWENIAIKVPFTQDGSTTAIHYAEVIKMLPYPYEEWAKIKVVNHE